MGIVWNTSEQMLVKYFLHSECNIPDIYWFWRTAQRWLSKCIWERLWLLWESLKRKEAFTGKSSEIFFQVSQERICDRVGIFRKQLFYNALVNRYLAFYNISLFKAFHSFNMENWKCLHYTIISSSCKHNGVISYQHNNSLISLLYILFSLLCMWVELQRKFVRPL